MPAEKKFKSKRTQRFEKETSEDLRRVNVGIILMLLTLPIALLLNWLQVSSVIITFVCIACAVLSLAIPMQAITGLVIYLISVISLTGGLLLQTICAFPLNIIVFVLGATPSLFVLYNWRGSGPTQNYFDQGGDD